MEICNLIGALSQPPMREGTGMLEEALYRWMSNRFPHRPRPNNSNSSNSNSNINNIDEHDYVVIPPIVGNNVMVGSSRNNDSNILGNRVEFPSTFSHVERLKGMMYPDERALVFKRPLTSRLHACTVFEIILCVGVAAILRVLPVFDYWTSQILPALLCCASMGFLIMGMLEGCSKRHFSWLVITNRRPILFRSTFFGVSSMSLEGYVVKKVVEYRDGSGNIYLSCGDSSPTRRTRSFPQVLLKQFPEVSLICHYFAAANARLERILEEEQSIVIVEREGSNGSNSSNNSNGVSEGSSSSLPLSSSSSPLSASSSSLCSLGLSSSSLGGGGGGGSSSSSSSSSSSVVIVPSASTITSSSSSSMVSPSSSVLPSQIFTAQQHQHFYATYGGTGNGVP